jgi:hypothetical protein
VNQQSVVKIVGNPDDNMINFWVHTLPPILVAVFIGSAVIGLMWRYSPRTLMKLAIGTTYIADIVLLMVAAAYLLKGIFTWDVSDVAFSVILASISFAVVKIREGIRLHWDTRSTAR